MAHAPLVIDLPGLERRPYGLLLDASPEIPASELQGMRWLLAGVTWMAFDCSNIETTTEDGCTALEPLDFDRGFGDSIEAQQTFMLWDAIRCSDLSVDASVLRGRVEMKLTVLASAGVASELMTGAASAGHAFVSDALSLGNTAETLRVGFAKLEAHLASKLHGAVGMIHVPPGVLTLALADSLVMGVNGLFRTATGHIVVGDAGYTGTATPDGATAANSSQAWLYASGIVRHAITDIQGLREAEENLIERNTESFYGHRYGIVAYDPCAVGAVKVTVA